MNAGATAPPSHASASARASAHACAARRGCCRASSVATTSRACHMPQSHAMCSAGIDHAKLTNTGLSRKLGTLCEKLISQKNACRPAPP